MRESVTKKMKVEQAGVDSSPQSHGMNAVDPQLLRKTMGCFATGVSVVTTKYQDQLAGMTVNSLTSVSLRPPLILVCLARDARTTRAVESRGWFVANILHEEQMALSNRFAQPAEDHFADLNFALNEYDLPVLHGCIAHLTCRVETALLSGDHIIVIGQVCQSEFTPGPPLLFLRGAYSKVQPRGMLDVPEAAWYW